MARRTAVPRHRARSPRPRHSLDAEPRTRRRPAGPRARRAPPTPSRGCVPPALAGAAATQSKARPAEWGPCRPSPRSPRPPLAAVRILDQGTRRRRSPAASVQPRGCRGAFAVLSPDRRGRGRAPPPLQLSWGGGPPAELPCPRAAAALARPRPRRRGAPPPAGFCSARDGLGERGGDGQGAREGGAAGERERGRERETGGREKKLS